MKEEWVPDGRAIWQSDTAKTYRCPLCQRAIFSQYEGADIPTITHERDSHRLVWRTHPMTEEDIITLLRQGIEDFLHDWRTQHHERPSE